VNPLILAGVSGTLVSIVDGSIGMVPHANLRSKIRDVVMDILVEAPLFFFFFFFLKNQQFIMWGLIAVHGRQCQDVVQDIYARKT
jgi:hypothetical protein